jgi:hypothetical protein
VFASALALTCLARLAPSALPEEASRAQVTVLRDWSVGSCRDRRSQVAKNIMIKIGRPTAWLPLTMPC